MNSNTICVVVIPEILTDVILGNVLCVMVAIVPASPFELYGVITYV